MVARRRDARGAVVNLLPDQFTQQAASTELSSRPILQHPMPPAAQLLGKLMNLAGSAQPTDGRSNATPSNLSVASALARPLTGFPRGGVRLADRGISGRDGVIPIRIYTPERPATTARPLVVEFHGGGWSVGDLDSADWISSTVARDLDAIVVSVDYRLSPQHPFPAGVNDCFDALKWAAANMRELGASAGRVGVMGESAGGNLAAVVGLLARDEGAPVIHHQALIYPAVDLTMTPRSRQVNAEAPVLNWKATEDFFTSYVGEVDPTQEWRLSPLRAPDKRHLPPALIQVAGHDPLYDDGIHYAEALRAADVQVRLTAYTAMPHGYINMPYLCREAGAAMREIVAEQRRYLCGS